MLLSALKGSIVSFSTSTFLLSRPREPPLDTSWMTSTSRALSTIPPGFVRKFSISVAERPESLVGSQRRLSPSPPLRL